jgi:YggT family protein
VWSAIGFLLWLFMLFLVACMVLEWVRYFVRGWRPKGVVLLLAEAVYTVTDPPLRAIRRLIPPVRLGGMGIDIAFMLLFFAVMILSSIVARL